MSDGQIGPHSGKELELMLAGEKPLAFFSVDPGQETDHVGDTGFAPYVESGRIRFFSKRTRLEVKHPRGRIIEIEWRAYCLPTEEWRAKLMLGLYAEGFSAMQLSPEDMARLGGTLLGYSKADVEAFVTRQARLHGTPERRAEG